MIQIYLFGDEQILREPDQCYVDTHPLFVVLSVLVVASWQYIEYVITHYLQWAKNTSKLGDSTKIDRV